MSYECGMRFLTDYLNGNKYFMVNYEDHNLNRAKNQIILAKKVIEKKELLSRIVKKLINHLSFS